MIDFNQIFEGYNQILVDHFDFTKFLIVTTLCLIIPTLYLYRKRKIARLKVVPKQTIIIHKESTTTITTEAKPDIDEKENLDISSYGGFIPYLRKLHSDQGVYVSSKLPYPNNVSVVDPMIIQATLSIGDRPDYLFKFLEPFLGEDNLQIFDADRADKFRRLVRSALGHDGNLSLSMQNSILLS